MDTQANPCRRGRRGDPPGLGRRPPRSPVIRHGRGGRRGRAGLAAALGGGLRPALARPRLARTRRPGGPPREVRGDSVNPLPVIVLDGERVRKMIGSRDSGSGPTTTSSSRSASSELLARDRGRVAEGARRSRGPVRDVVAFLGGDRRPRVGVRSGSTAAGVGDLSERERELFALPRHGTQGGSYRATSY